MSEALRVALTFDAEHPDRPGCPPANADAVLDVLRRRDVRATIFIQGRWAQAYPDTAKRIADEHHLIGHHSHYHARMTLLHDAGIAADIRQGQDAIREAAGVDPRPWFRAPFGDGHADVRVLGGLGELGYRNIHWDVELQDWEPWRTPDDLVELAVNGVESHGDGAVILLHTWPAVTAAALDPMIDRLTAMGAAFVTVDQLGAAS